jgi:hypothetical protein
MKPPGHRGSSNGQMDTAINNAPVITSNPPFSATVGVMYS